MMDQSEVALEIKDHLDLGDGHRSEVHTSHVPPCHKDMFAVGVSHVCSHYCICSELFEQPKQGHIQKVTTKVSDMLMSKP